MHHVEFVLPNLVVSFFVRDIEPVLRQTVIDHKTYTEYVFRQDNRCMIVRRRPGEPNTIVFQHELEQPATAYATVGSDAESADSLAIG